MSSMHEYPVTVNWQGGRDGAGTVGLDASGVSNPIGVPAEFQGTGQGTNPEEMLTGAIASCYSMTFGIIAAMRKLSFAGIETKATGFVEQNGANFVYTKVVIRPTIQLNSDAGDDQVTLAEDMAHKADLYCIITNAVRGKVEVVVEPNIVR